MGAPIAVIRATPEDRRKSGHPNLAARMEEVGMTADIYLESEKSRNGACVYEYGGERYKYVIGSRALFDRWVVENDLRVTT